MTSSPVQSDEPSPAATTATKGARTRERIYGCAMELFMSSGYEKTTMRMIADRAEVNVGLSYRYFPSKEHLVFEFYRRFTADFIGRAAAVVTDSPRLETRLIAVIETMFAAADPYHGFAGSLFATAASPSSPLNPFSADSTEGREDGIALFARVIDDCTPRVPADLATDLPFLLWGFSLVMMYSWMHDRSEGQEQTRLLLHRSARLVAGLVRMSSSPGARSFRRQLLSITGLIRSRIPASG